MAVERPRTEAETWLIRETSPSREETARFETIFSLGNGTLGMRGNFEEGFPGSVPGTFLNGFYDETPILYGEIAYGYARNRQVMLNVVDAKPLRLSVDGEPLDLSTGTILSYERTLDMARGVLARSVTWKSPGGAVVELLTRRLVSLEDPGVAAIEWRARLASGGGTLVAESALDAAVGNRAAGTDPRIGSRFPERPLLTLHRQSDGPSCLLVQETRNTKMRVACAAQHVLFGDGPARARSAVGPERAAFTVEIAAEPGAVLGITKYISYVSSRQVPAEECAGRAREAARRAAEAGFASLLAGQKQYLDRFWSAADVQIEGDQDLQQSLRFNLFSLLQSAGRDGRTSIAAKGLSGEGYEGHYFWDTEVYVLPFFTYTRPEIARALLRYRIGTLDKARARAAEMSQRGALFPWRTIGGEETSAYYPAGTAQYHINGDIAYALRKYLTATGDRSLLVDGGAELLFETARLWVDLGSRSVRRGGAFCINEVTGPDEYTALVNNNLYTNMMARENLLVALQTVEELHAEQPAVLQRIAGKIGLTEEEPAAWKRAAETMYVPFDPMEGIHLQDDAFLDRKKWDFEGTPADRHPLLLHYHPLVIYRHQVLKQPDVVLAQVLLGHRFSRAEKKRNFDFYDPLTTGDSSLSPCIQSVAAAELGYRDLAFQYFSRTARMDLDDVNRNVSDGLHTAAMAGTWISIVYGFGGFRETPSVDGRDGGLSFAPQLPASWKRLQFRLRVRGSLLQVAVSRDEAVYSVSEGPAVRLASWGRPLTVEPGTEARDSLAPRLRAVIFDLDGVLTDSAELHYRAWQRLCDEAGIPFDRTVNEELRGIGRQESLQIILRHAGARMTEPEARAFAERKNALYRQLIGTLTPADLLPGIPELLPRLRAESIRIAVASASRNAPAILDRLQIGSLFDFVVDPGLLVKGKPDPETFLRAAEGLEVTPRDCAGVEDARAGIQAIKAAGMYAVGIGPGLTEADWTLGSTAELTLEALKARFASAAAHG
jgi:beta-phosphoglucomutase